MDWRDVKDQGVVEKDSFDCLRHGEVANNYEKMSSFAAKGRAMPSLMADVFSAFYKVKPELRDEIPLSMQNRRMVFEEALKTSEWRDLRMSTVMDMFSSAIAEISWLEKMDSEQQADFESGLEMEVEEEIEQLLFEADDLNDMPKTNSVKNRLKAVRKTIKGKKADLKALRESHQDFSPDEVRRRVRKQLREVREEVEEISEQVSMWGTDPGAPMKMPAGEKFGAAAVLKHSNKLREISKLAGRLRAIAMHKFRTKSSYARSEVKSIELGNDIGRILPSELISLKYRKLDFYRRFIEGKLLQYKLEGKETEGRGPIICCVDNSGSMSGDPEHWSKAVMLALLALATKEKRNFHLIHFGNADQLKRFDFLLGEIDQSVLLECATFFFSGGTDFETPLNEALRIIQEEEPKADIVFITDEECATSEGFLEEYHKLKKEKEFKCMSVLVGSQSTGACERFSDEVTELSDLSDDEEATNMVFKI